MNMVKIADGIYLVRTQAGFRKAVKSFSRNVHFGDKAEVVGYPRSYPSIVSLSLGYEGYHYVECNSVHVNAMKEAIEKLDSEGTSCSTVS